MKSAAIVLSGLGLLAATYAAGPAMAADHSAGHPRSPRRHRHLVAAGQLGPEQRPGVAVGT